jgi:hypothetical protein
MRQTKALVIAALMLSTPPALAQDVRVIGQIRSSGPVTTDASRKIVSSLRALVADFHAHGITRGNAPALDAGGRFSSETLKVDATGRVQVYVFVTDTADAALAALRSHDLDIELVSPETGIVQGWVPVENLESLAAEQAVVKIRPPSYTRHETGPVTSEGDAIHRCDQARALGFTGAGIKVGVVSDGVLGLGASQAAGELGAVQVLTSGPGDEGTAVLEIIADCAPGATLMFASGGFTSAAFTQAVNMLKDAGAQIIVDDVAAFLTEPFFEDSATALNDRAVGASLLRVSSAGNRGQAHYQAAFTPGSFDPVVPGTRHNFGGGDELLRFHLPGGATATIYLQWGNRFGAAGDDYDLCVRQTSGVIAGCSVGTQNGNDDPLEALTIICPGLPGSSCAADIQVTLFSGSAQVIELFCTTPCQFDEFNNRGDSVVGHKAVPEVLAVAASPASSPTSVESYSAAGPATILFPAPETRFKPDLDAVDCVRTSRPGFNPFCGTSAAAPHVAAVAALLMQAMGSSATVQSVTSVLKSTAVDLGAPGPDFDFGFGRVDALAAVQSATGVSLASAVLPTSRSVLVGAPATAFATVIAIGTATAKSCGIAPITSIPATFQYQTTDASNQVTGAPNTPADIAGGAAQTFVIAITPTAPFGPTDVQLSFSCSNAAAAPVVSGLNTLLLSASATPVPDIVALAATLNNDGIVNVPGPNGTGVFSVATVNVGVGGAMIVTADTGGAVLPVSLLLCQTNPTTGSCTSPMGTGLTTTIDAGTTPTFAIFVAGTGTVPFNPALNRVFVRFTDASTIVRGATSVAVRTQ